MARRSLTGVKPTGAPHIGNLLGAIKPALALQDTYEAFYFVASYHALTTVQDRVAMRTGILEVGATWLALGLDPTRTTIFNQHDIPELCELAWVLGLLCGLEWSSMNRPHSSLTVGALRASALSSPGSPPRRTSASQSWASDRACSTVSSPNWPSAGLRRTPEFVRY